MKTVIRFLSDRRAVSPVIGTILMVAITVVMAAIVGGFVYQTGKPKSAPQLSTTLEDDVRVVLRNNTDDDRVARLLIEGGARVTASELLAIVTYTDDSAGEVTATLDGTRWVAGSNIAMGTNRITLFWHDSDGSGDLSPGDRLDFQEGDQANAAGEEVVASTDFTVKIVHKSSESVLSSHTIRVY